MADQTAIEWADSTFNPWMGCTKISPACDHCYAERDTARLGLVGWGPGAPRVRTSATNWRKPVQWNDRLFWRCIACTWRGEGVVTAEDGHRCPACDGKAVEARRRVFCASLADVFDNEVNPQWRDDLFDLIAATPNLDWLLLTKRIGNVRGMLPATWTIGATKPWPNVWLGATICNQAEADRDIPKLLAIPAAKRFLSIEPMLGPIHLNAIRDPHFRTLGSALSGCGYQSKVDWVIVGGESGPHARPMHPDWVRSLRDQCTAAGAPFLFKQWGEWRPPIDGEHYDTSMGRAQRVPCYIVAPAGTVHCFEKCGWTDGGKVMRRVGKKAAGNTLDGRQHLEWPR